MKKKNCCFILGVVMGIVTAVGVLTAISLIKKKKKREDEELEYYLDYSIQ